MMEILVPQSLQTFMHSTGYSLLPNSDQAIDLSSKSKVSETVNVSISTMISSFNSYNIAIPPADYLEQPELNRTRSDENNVSEYDNTPESLQVDVENDIDDAESTGTVSEEALEITNLRRSLPQLDAVVELHCKVGEGTFSSVYLATARNNPNVKLAVKHLTPTCHPSRIKRELQCLRDIGGQDNVSGLLQCVRNNGCVVFLMHYQPHQRFQDYVLHMDAAEARLYMYNLLIALRRVHSFGIIHRDVKPGNFLYDRENKKFMLVDFGLAQSVDSTTLNADKLPVTTVPHTNKSKASVSHTKLQQNKQCLRKYEFMKRKRNEENSTKHTPIMESPNKRRALAPQNDNQKNIVPFKPPMSLPKLSPQFQLLLPTSMQSTPKQPPSYVRVQNSRVKIFSAPLQSDPSKPRCQCLGKPQVCEICLKRKKIVASRAGTPGFRPPEVLLKSVRQTTAVDMWAVGVLLLSILSGCYPFFKSPDDMTALAELMTIFGTKSMKDIAVKLNRMLGMDQEKPPLDFKKMCIKLRTSRLAAKQRKSQKQEDKSSLKCPVCGPSLESPSGDIPCLCQGSFDYASTPSQFPDEAYDLLHRLLDLNPDTRITAEQALEHSFIKNVY